MIISASRRTDIPALYAEWFMKRIKEGYVFTRNPMNYHQISRINLSPDVVDCIVFWTKNPENILDSLKELDQRKYFYYFLFTLNPYGSDIEKKLPEKPKIIESFIKLSDMLGKQRVIWRYDPVLFTDVINEKYHTEKFEELVLKLKDYTSKCIISFLDPYDKIKGSLKSNRIRVPNDDEIKKISTSFSKIAQKYGLQLQTCAEEAENGIKHGRCIDDNLIPKSEEQEISYKKDKCQRSECGCMESIDIGAYNTCTNGCVYCYANFSKEFVDKNVSLHNKNYPLLVGSPRPDDKISERKMSSCKKVKQPELPF